MSDPFHEGERAVQEQAGERNIAIRHGRLIADKIPKGARLFVGQQKHCVLGRSAPGGDIWASFVTGPQGFAQSDDEGRFVTLAIGEGLREASKAREGAAINVGDHFGLLFIELETRRRLRVNGRVTEIASGELRLAVDQAFPNCPKYIQRRELQGDGRATARSEIITGTDWDGQLEDWVLTADTFFVASAYPGGNADVSHRGGKPGFLQIIDGVIHVPDYPGNSMFGTLGNFALNPRAGLVFVDFENSRQLQMTGRVELDLGAGKEPGEERWWRFRLLGWAIAPLAHGYTWRFDEASPYNP